MRAAWVLAICACGASQHVAPVKQGRVSVAASVDPTLPRKGTLFTYWMTKDERAIVMSPSRDLTPLARLLDRLELGGEVDLSAGPATYPMPHAGPDVVYSAVLDTQHDGIGSLLGTARTQPGDLTGDSTHGSGAGSDPGDRRYVDEGRFFLPRRFAAHRREGHVPREARDPRGRRALPHARDPRRSRDRRPLHRRWRLADVGSAASRADRRRHDVVAGRSRHHRLAVRPADAGVDARDAPRRSCDRWRWLLHVVRQRLVARRFAARLGAADRSRDR